ncbi:hypothetical protein [Novosphingobium sp. KN65.2]|uniref:hypothetical protein n=1 Tax=Novosphingobium sp. KN65.2 TaxID=1478134 RepID=UPI0005DBC492|nr:hypothetical protein [Novosphingobium sp. KN65.2]CDO35631.1 conserved exported hypothetical protein [Novosphingobium sp. KN65.2]
MKRSVALSIAVLPLALAACAKTAPGEAPPASPAAEVIGKAVSCLPLTSYSTTRIRDDWTIDFIGGAGSKVWRVTLPQRCAGLKSADSFSFETSLTQLCRNDIIYPIRQYGGQYQRQGACGLSDFVPVKLLDK